MSPSGGGSEKRARAQSGALPLPHAARGVESTDPVGRQSHRPRAGSVASHSGGDEPTKARGSPKGPDGCGNHTDSRLRPKGGRHNRKRECAPPRARVTHANKQRPRGAPQI